MKDREKSEPKAIETRWSKRDEGRISGERRNIVGNQENTPVI